MQALLEDILSRIAVESATTPSPATNIKRRAASRAVHALFLCETRAFLAAARALPMAQHSTLCAMAQHLIPQLAETAAAAAAAETGAPAAQQGPTQNNECNLYENPIRIMPNIT